MLSNRPEWNVIKVLHVQEKGNTDGYFVLDKWLKQHISS